MFLVEKVKNSYRITEGLRLYEIFEEKIEKYMIEAIKARVKEYLAKTDILFNNKNIAIENSINNKINKEDYSQEIKEQKKKQKHQ